MTNRRWSTIAAGLTAALILSETGPARAFDAGSFAGGVAGGVFGAIISQSIQNSQQQQGRQQAYPARERQPRAERQRQPSAQSASRRTPAERDAKPIEPAGGAVAPGDPVEAVAWYDEQIKKRPKDSSLYVGRGDAYLRKGDPDIALADYDEAVRTNGKNTKARLARASLLLSRQKYDEAAADAGEAIRLDARSAAGYVMRGRIRYAAGKNEDASADFVQAVRLAPKSADGYLGRGLVALRAKDHAAAIVAFNQAIAADPKAGAAYAGRARAFEATGAFDSALTDAVVALNLTPDDVESKALQDRLKARMAPQTTATAAASVIQMPAPPVITPASLREPPPAGAAAALSAIEPTAGSERRVALVIGNADYAAAGRLDNPINDARDIASVLRDLSFDVQLEENLNRTRFEQTIAAFSSKASSADVVMLYYSGHGMGLGGDTFLMPVDADFRSEYEAQRGNIGLTQLLDTLKSPSGIVMAFIDACRNNPLAEQLVASARSQGRSVSAKRGLEAIQVNGSETLLVYATSPGRTADDGRGRNSPFTSAILENMRTPGIEVETMLKRVSTQVKTVTQGQQEPERLSRLGKEFYFKPAAKKEAAPRANDATAPANAERDFLFAKDAASIAVWNSFLQRHGEGFYAELARAELKKLGAPASPANAQP